MLMLDKEQVTLIEEDVRRARITLLHLPQELRRGLCHGPGKNGDTGPSENSGKYSLPNR
jgi:hypothetical protein